MPQGLGDAKAIETTVTTRPTQSGTHHFLDDMRGNGDESPDILCAHYGLETRGIGLKDEAESGKGNGRTSWVWAEGEKQEENEKREEIRESTRRLSMVVAVQQWNGRR